ncbi:myrosinase 1-like [Aricia agestis]|uniref:myrosinase 1-like n=1 Tax=Aricia agestis TaxID=91739 RepID=UPI001C2054FA|nr:myrosinase 1-like [Aricia agestis]
MFSSGKNWFVMRTYQTLIVCVLIGQIACDQDRRIPRDFMLGSGLSSYQYEGAWNEDGRGPSFWDAELHNPKPKDFVIDNSNADLAADGYHLYKEDIQLVKDMGLDSLRFSFSWPRILPTGYANKINQAGIDYYNDFIDELLKYNITPIATMYQMDMPAKLLEYGSWTNPAVVDFFLDYVKILYDNFGDRVKLWITINEPFIYCYYSYSNIGFPPFLDLSGVGDYICMKNMLIANARAYRLYHKHYRKQQGGQVGLILLNNWHEPLTNSTDDVEAADDSNKFMNEMFLHAIFSEVGGYPKIVKQKIDAKSAEQGFPRSRLPPLSESEIKMIKGTADFVGLNSYFTSYVYRNRSVDDLHHVPSMLNDVYIGFDVDPAALDASYRFKSVPDSAYKLLMNIKESYNNPPIYITENGYTTQGGLDDDDRVEYINDFLNAVLDAREGGCDVRGYNVWSFIDLFEWKYGYVNKYGLYEVDFSSPNRTRTARKSAHYYKNIATTRTISKKVKEIK